MSASSGLIITKEQFLGREAFSRFVAFSIMMIFCMPRRWLLGIFILSGVGFITTGRAAKESDSKFGDAVQLAPYVVSGKQLSISIHARTQKDRRYAEEFAEDVVEVAYQTMGDLQGNGLVIIGREQEPHPLTIFQKFLTMVADDQLNPEVAAKAAELTAMIAEFKAMSRMEDDKEEEVLEKMDWEDGADEVGEREGENEVKLTLEMVLPALPLHLKGIGSKLYQLSWEEGFDELQIEQKLRSLTIADLQSDALSKYSWVYYLPPRKAYIAVQKEMIKEVVKQREMGLFKRAAMRSALFVLKPAIKKAVEGMRKGVLFMTVLRAESDYPQDDIMKLSGAYMKVLMPDFKINGGSEQRRALEAIEAQKIRNAEDAKHPFVSPDRLVDYDPATYAPFEGEYRLENEKVDVWFKRKGDVYLFGRKDRKAVVYYPAGDRLLVTSNGKMTIEFQVDESGNVTGVEQRWERRRLNFVRES